VTDLLIINPNTTASITDLLRERVRLTLGDDAGEIDAITARFGAPYIASEASYAVAAHSTLDAWSAWQVDHASTRPGAILIGCFGDPGLMALRECAATPVIGLAEASFIEASVHGRFVVVTGGDRWRPILGRLAYSLGYEGRMAGVHTVTPDGAQLAADPDGAARLLARACREAVVATHASAVVLGGAGLAGMASRIQSMITVPVIDSVDAGARQAMRLSNRSKTKSTPGFDVPWSGLSAEMTALGRTPQEAAPE